jgi:type II secretory ATPase GspE/PulE/Tfp pilus assembly ATPase PilB-like protein
MGNAQGSGDKVPPVVEKSPRVIGKVDLTPAAGTPADAKEARGLPGFKEARTFVAAALAGEAASVLLSFDGPSCTVHWRTPAGWLLREPLGQDAAAPLLAVLKKLAAPLSEVGPGLSAGAFIVTEKCQWRCRSTVRKAEKREQWLLQFTEELPSATGLVQRLGGMVSGLLPAGRRKAGAEAAADGAPPPVKVELQPQGKPPAASDAAGLEAAAAVCGRALAIRGCGVRLESTGGPVSVRADVDGVWRPLDPLEKATGAAVLSALKTVAGFAADAVRPLQTGACTTVVEGKPWPCTVVATRGKGGERLDVQFGYGRPVFKTLADTGMDNGLRTRVQEIMSLAQGVVVVAAPRRNGLSTLFEHVMLTADRLMRDFVSIEDAAAPLREVQNVKTCRWDAAAKISPVDAVEKALREYPQGLVTCDLTDPALARKLVELAEQGQFVVLGVNGGDVGDALTTILGLGVPAEQLARVLLGGVGSRLVRKLCPKCREEYLPSVDELAAVRLDATAAVSLWRASVEGCEVCGGSGYLGRTGIFEVAAGRTLQHYVAKAADAATLRKAAVKDGMVPLSAAALDLVKAGVTSLDEVRRVFAPTPSKAQRAGQPAG